MGNAQQGDALPGAVGIFQPIAGLGAEKPGFRVPAPAAVGGMENPVVRNEVGQLPLAEHRKVEAVAPWQIPRGAAKAMPPWVSIRAIFSLPREVMQPQLRVLPATRASWRISFSWPHWHRHRQRMPPPARRCPLSSSTVRFPNRWPCKFRIPS